MAIDLPDDLVKLERSAWEALQRLGEIPKGFPPRTLDWTDEQHAAWDEALADSRKAAGCVQQAVREHAAEMELSRREVEMAVKQAVRHDAAA